MDENYLPYIKITPFLVVNLLQILINRLEDKVEMNKDSLTLRDVQRAYGKSQPGQMLGADSPWAKTFLTELGKKIKKICIATLCFLR